MKDYKITIQSTIDGETNQVITFGDVSREYGSVTVDYVDGESLAPTRIVMSEDLVSIIKDGEISTVLTFERDKITEADLQTEYGVFPFSYRTVDMKFAQREDGVDLKLAYVTAMGGEENRFDIILRADRVR